MIWWIAQPRCTAWQNQTTLQTARALCEPYGIKVVDEVGLSEVFDNFASQPGETVAKALVRLARLRGVWIGDTAPDGTLRFFDPGKKRVPYQLDLGEHLVRVRAYEDRAKRFGVVQMLGKSAKGTPALATGEVKVSAHGAATTTAQAVSLPRFCAAFFYQTINPITRTHPQPRATKQHEAMV